MEFILLSLCWRQIIVPLMQGFWHWNHENGIEWSNVPHLLSDVILFSDNEEVFPSFCWSLSSQTLSPRQLSRFWSAFCPPYVFEIWLKIFQLQFKIWTWSRTPATTAMISVIVFFSLFSATHDSWIHEQKITSRLLQCCMLLHTLCLETHVYSR